MQIRFAIVLFMLLITVEVVVRCTAQNNPDKEKESENDSDGSDDSDNSDEFRRLLYSPEIEPCEPPKVVDVHGICRYLFFGSTVN